MRFAVLEGNPTAIIDRAEGVVYHLQYNDEAVALCELLNSMHGELISVTILETGEPSFSNRKIGLPVKCINTGCINYDGSLSQHCAVKTSVEACDEFIPMATA